MLVQSLAPSLVAGSSQLATMGIGLDVGNITLYGSTEVGPKAGKPGGESVLLLHF